MGWLGAGVVGRGVGQPWLLPEKTGWGLGLRGPGAELSCHAGDAADACTNAAATTAVAATT